MERLLAALPLPAPRHAAAHRWRYALADRPLGEGCVWDAALRLGLCGDWCIAGRAEAAFDSGAALARAVLG
jgi:predicted NAD/FAD-dependent oxidoreductase